MGIINRIYTKSRNQNTYLGYKHHRYDYYIQHNIIKNIIMFNQKISLANQLPTDYLVDVDILPLNIRLGSYFYEVTSKLGKPRFEISKNIGKNHKVLFYRKKIGACSFLAQFHFYSNQLVFVKLDFDYLMQGEFCRESIIDVLFKKYSISNESNINNDICVMDANNNILKISDTGRISLEYYSGDEELKESIYSTYRIKNIISTHSIDYSLIHDVI